MIVERIVPRHRGRVWAESAPGLGATFFFALAADGGPAPEHPASPHPAPASPGSGPADA